MQSLRRRVERFWKEDRGLSILLAFLAIVSFVAAPLAHSFPGGDTVLSLMVSLLFAAGAFVVTDRFRRGFALAAVAMAPIALEWVRRSHPTPGVRAAESAASLLFIGILIAFVSRRVLKSGPVTVHQIVGAVAIYLLLGLGFGEAARVIDALDPGAYSVPGTADNRIDLYYFSFVTLTTTGYGDITPAHPLARALAVLEAVTGQMFPAILIARLVSQELMNRPRRD
ncbi:MAG TPA: potassium channel family protein [Dongiaceae bacterium]|nr:potassium channel family protein [Dongiaceae bacterium]